MSYAISEIFTSLQGEGLFSGTPMTFVRFAGCSVGRPVAAADRNPDEPAYRELCHSFDGRSFLCDTDFRRKLALSLDELLELIPVRPERVCFTGGEPLNHDLSELAEALQNRGQLIHVETSGTVKLPQWSFDETWVTVSPKQHVLPAVLQYADEVKLLISNGFDLTLADNLVRQCAPHTLVWVQPINSEWDLDRKNLEQCLEVLKLRPAWRLSSQLHKIWKVR